MNHRPRQGVAYLYRFFLCGLIVASGCRDENPTNLSGTPATLGESVTRYTDPQAAIDPAVATKALPALPVVEPAPKPTERMPTDATCVTASCHTTFATARYGHGPVATGDCDACHGDDTGDHSFPLHRDGRQTCTFCHPVLAGFKNPHQPLTESGCSACHRPHVADTKFLLTSATVERVCVRCHEMPDMPRAHAPFATGECTICHDPHASNTQNLLRGGDGPQHCYMCHTETRYAITNAPHIHKPVAESCTTCHAPHASPHEHLLNLPIEQICFSCHRDVEDHIQRAVSPHAAVFTADRCANCHDPHASGRPKLLRDRLERLCLRCHDKSIEAADGRTIPDMRPTLTARTYLHGPVESGDCSACHNVHGATHTRLLREMFPSTFYATFDLESYALCFRCHEKSLVLEANTTTLTGFRDGNVNLHFLHVNRQKKGRTCKTCHAIHGSDLPKHMASEVPFEGSQWSMPIRFVKSVDGGRCAPGCHKPLAYRRGVQHLRASTQEANGAP